MSCRVCLKAVGKNRASLWYRKSIGIAGFGAAATAAVDSSYYMKWQFGAMRLKTMSYRRSRQRDFGKPYTAGQYKLYRRWTKNRQYGYGV